MSRDKSRIIVGGRTLLQHVRAAAVATGLPVRTVRTDVVPRCGPLGGILTGLTRARSGWGLVLTCDMPLVTPGLLEALRRKAGRLERPVFVHTAKGFGFPLALPVDSAVKIERLIASRKLSLQQLAAAVGARKLRLPAARRRELANANTPADLDVLRQRLCPRVLRTRW